MACKVKDNGKPILLVTNDDGIDAPGIRALITCLVTSGHFQVFVCAPNEERSACGHSINVRETLEANNVEIEGTIAYSLTGYPADCVSLGISGELFSWKKPNLVISGINKGANSGYHIIYSGTVAGAREAFMSDVPAIAISLDWNSKVSKEEYFSHAAQSILPLIISLSKESNEHDFLKKCFLNIDVPINPLNNKGFCITRQGSSRITPKWSPITKRRTGAQLYNQMYGQKMTPFELKKGAIGSQLAQLGLAASAAGAARKNLKSVENEETKLDIQEPQSDSKESDDVIPNKLYFHNEGGSFDDGEKGHDIDYVALSEGWITITPLELSTQANFSVFEGLEPWINSLKN